ncbi:hypothetical protein M3182_07730 [Mesobacillus maritimus]|uniref:hypothetical protein n=1 Tax=Mesobacillus maritimus TaxID=1643336 RepID=UPI0020423675|nr:hypothetical protein [Mesobacillus maritimus]MCM3585638.1 hypothetical protein [Mesobacillus maritimus]MCM3669110.1 hypothetical protein [Mesobacillus maritimus]
MKRTKETQIALQIIALDLKRDQLYEELLKTLGWKAHAFLRFVQNNHSSEGESHHEY